MPENKLPTPAGPRPDMAKAFASAPPFPSDLRDDGLRAEIRALAAKVDALHAALVKPQSSIIIVSANSTIMGDKDVARIVAEITKKTKGGAA